MIILTENTILSEINNGGDNVQLFKAIQMEYLRTFLKLMSTWNILDPIALIYAPVRPR